MKIKNDFITNSSSTSYVLCGPKKILDEDIEELINKVYEDYDHDDDLETIADTSKEELRDRIETIFNNGGGLYQDDELFFAIINLAEEREWVINKSDSAPDAGQISILSNKDIEKIKKIRNLGEGGDHG